MPSRAAACNRPLRVPLRSRQYCVYEAAVSRPPAYAGRNSNRGRRQDWQLLFASVAYHGSSGCDLLPSLLHRVPAWNSMKKFKSTLSRTIAMMIAPPTAWPSAMEMPLATTGMMTRGLIKKRRRLRRVAKRDSFTRLFGPCGRNRSRASPEVKPDRSGLEQFQQLRPGLVPEALHRQGLIRRTHPALAEHWS